MAMQEISKNQILIKIKPMGELNKCLSKREILKEATELKYFNFTYENKIREETYLRILNLGAS